MIRPPRISTFARKELSRRRLLHFASLPLAAVLPVSTGWCAADNSILTPEAFGAKGDGRSDDTDAFLALSAFINKNDGGIVELRRGATYLIGRQNPSKSFYLAGVAVLHAEHVSRFEVRMNGATLKFRDGLKFGSFDRTTGAVRETSVPHLIPADRADIGYAISADSVGVFSVSSGTIDCNSRKAVIGGFYGDIGRQCIQAGVMAMRCGRVEWSDLEIMDSCQDGMLYGFYGLTGKHPPKPLIIRNVRVTGVARNCLSLIGTNTTLIEDCTFQNAGEAPNDRLGWFGSAPASCLDVEAEEAECRNVVVRNSRLISGKNSDTAFVADSGITSDILVEDSLLVGAVWAAKPRVIFRRCTIKGLFAKLSGGHTDQRDNSQVVDCTLTDITDGYKYVATSPHAIDLQAAGAGVVISRSKISVSRTRLNLRLGRLSGVTITFATGTNAIENKSYAILADAAVLTDVTIIDRIPANRQPRDAFFVTAPASAIRSAIISSDAKLLWNSWSRNANGYAGKYVG